MHSVIASSLTAIKETLLRSGRVEKGQKSYNHRTQGEMMPLYSIVHCNVHSTIPVHYSV